MARVCTRFLEESFDLFCESCFHVESFVIDEGSDHHLIINFFLVGNKDLDKSKVFFFGKDLAIKLKLQPGLW